MTGMFTQTVDGWNHPTWWYLLFGLPFSLGALLLINQSIADREVAARQQLASATITSHEPSNHNRYGYHFSVNGQSFSGWESPRGSEPVIGQRVSVYYDPKDPSTNALTDFNERADEILGPVPCWYLALAAWHLAFIISVAGMRHANLIRLEDAPSISPDHPLCCRSAATRADCRASRPRLSARPAVSVRSPRLHGRASAPR